MHFGLHKNILTKLHLAYCHVSTVGDIWRRRTVNPFMISINNIEYIIFFLYELFWEKFPFCFTPAITLNFSRAISLFLAYIHGFLHLILPTFTPPFTLTTILLRAPILIHFCLTDVLCVSLIPELTLFLSYSYFPFALMSLSRYLSCCT